MPLIALSMLPSFWGSSCEWQAMSLSSPNILATYTLVCSSWIEKKAYDLYFTSQRPANPLPQPGIVAGAVGKTENKLYILGMFKHGHSIDLYRQSYTLIAVEG